VNDASREASPSFLGSFESDSRESRYRFLRGVSKKNSSRFFSRFFSVERCACHFLSLSLSRSRASVHSRIVDVAKRRSIMTIGRAGQVFREAAIRGHRLTRCILGICVEHNSFALRKLARAESCLAKSHALSIADRMHGVTKGQGYAVARSPGSPSKHLSRIVISRL